MSNINDKFFCYDCSKRDIETEIIIKDGEIKNGIMLEFKLPKNERRIIFKCNDCYKENQSYNDFQKCEVYSRIVGYLRPVSQWHKGKQQEYKDRKVYKT